MTGIIEHAARVFGVCVERLSGAQRRVLGRSQ
jgi:hypothetical protein